ncbi:MAG: sensor histidine kinase KdpD [Lachnospiraceae bacterium]|nr:sensor histidine kinase KdpD [Lachnospiraceae bacterium]
MSSQEKAVRQENILVCLSPSPSNQKVILAAVKMAQAFEAPLVGLYIRTSSYDALPETDKERLKRNIRLLQENHGSVTIIDGDDIAMQIAEFAILTGVTKIVVGRTGATRSHFWEKSSLTEQVILNVPDVDVYIIPDSAADLKHRNSRLLQERIVPSAKEMLYAFLVLIAATLVGLLFQHFGFSEANIITIYILGVLILSIVTVSQGLSAFGALASVLLFNYFFIEPRFSFHAYETEYLVTFAIMLIAGLITGSLANRLQANAKHSAHEAFRAKVLFDTNQLFQKAENKDEVLEILAKQVTTLLNRDVIIFPENDGALGEGVLYAAEHAESDASVKEAREIAEDFFAEKEALGSALLKRENAQYYRIQKNAFCYGVMVIETGGNSPEAFENSVLLSMIGECALTLENLRNAQEKERASLRAQNETLRANLLRSISHDIRTPLTSISGNASNLRYHFDQLDAQERQQMFTDIHEDAMWLSNLVENILSISRIEDGKMKLHLSVNALREVVDEALLHIDEKGAQDEITVTFEDELLLADMDAKLISQVMINLVNNAIKNCPPGAKIEVHCEQQGALAVVSVTDDGPGVALKAREHIFEMFYTGETGVADGRRGLGLGLALCKSIVEAHGGNIYYEENEPKGSRFTFTLPVKEVTIHEETDDFGGGR